MIFLLARSDGFTVAFVRTSQVPELDISRFSTHIDLRDCELQLMIHFPRPVMSEKGATDIRRKINIVVPT